MKIRPLFLCFLSVTLASRLIAEEATEAPLIEPTTPVAPPVTPPPPPSVPTTPPADLPAPTPGNSMAPEPADPAATPAADTPADPAVAQANQEIQKSDEGFIIKDAALNDIFQYLAKSAGKQYFHNAKIAGADFKVTGHLNDGNPLQQMEELAFMYGLTLHTKGSTIYALTQAQLNQLPAAEFHYQLRYLRPTDMEQIKELVKPLLSPGTGIVNFEPKTNTIIIIDATHRIEQAREFLRNIDQAKGQIIVETKILRVNSAAAERTGVDWSGSLGETGASISVARSLNSIFGLRSSFSAGGTTSYSPGALNTLSATEGVSNNLVLSPMQLNGVLRALAEGELATQLSNPTLITEDNEQATVSLIDRIPIVTSSSTTSNGVTNISEEVRYKIDTSDKSIDADPEKHREIGISIVVTPTLLPDGTVRMKLRPRSAQISGEVIGQTKNKYPRVTEAMIESLARVPDGHSLVVGGFYGEVKNDSKSKIPLLGDVPVLNFFFKSKEASKERTSLVFIVTPKSYNPANRSDNAHYSNRIHGNVAIGSDYAELDPNLPGAANEPNFRRTLENIRQNVTVQFPTEQELGHPQTPGQPKKSSKPKFSQAAKR